MISIKSTFYKIQDKQPSLGAFPVLAQVVKGKRFAQSSITRVFTKLVPKNEYVLSERRALIKYLTNLSNPLEDDTIIAKNKQGSLFQRGIDNVTV